MASIPRPPGNMIMLSRKVASIDTTIGVQRRLNQMGFDAGTEDNIYGPKTTAAVKRFQQFCKDHAGEHFRIMDSGPVDGIVGPITTAALLRFYGS